MALRLDVSGSARNIIRDLRQVKTEIVPRETARALNRQRDQFTTRMTRKLSAQLNVKPQKRIRRRLLKPKPGRALPRRLQASGLMLFKSLPGHYFAKGKRGRGARGVTLNLPAGAVPIRHGQQIGQPFLATTRKGYTLLFVRVAPPYSNETRKKKAQKQTNTWGWTWLPVHKVMIDVSRVANRERQKQLVRLSQEFPKAFDKRMANALKRKGVVTRAAFS